MKKHFVFFSAALTALLTFASVPVNAKLHIVATTPDLADVVRRVGGDLVQVESLAKGTEDIHAVPQRPSFIPKLNQADAVVHIGLGAEHAFLPALLDAASNAKLFPGKEGNIDCSVHIAPKEVPTVISRAEGDQHPDGNPHYATDPRTGALIAQAIAEGLSRLDPKNADVYAKNQKDFAVELDKKIAEWRAMTAGLKGTKIVSYHKDMIYFADFLGFEIVGEIEPKPGIAPTPRHLEELVGLMKSSGVKLILSEVQYSEKTADWLSTQTGAKVAVVATMGNAFPDSGTYIGMVDHNVKAILQALK